MKAPKKNLKKVSLFFRLVREQSHSVTLVTFLT